nr:hypothetical protein [Tanacetum cinerariifolium]
MAAPVISISSDVSVERVGSSFSQVIPIGSSSVEVPVAPEEGAATVALPAEIPVAPILPTSFAVVKPSSEFPLAPVVAPPRIRRQRAILIRPGEDIPIALTYTSHHLDHFTSGSSSGHSSSNHLSSGHSVLGHSLYGHASPDTTIADSSTPLTTSKSSARDSSSESSTGPSQDIEDDATAVEVVVDKDIVAGVDAGIDMEVDARVDVEDEVESSDRGTMEVLL